MVPASVLAYLQSAITCSTVFFSGNFVLPNKHVALAISREPTNILNSLTAVPGNCATLIFDNATVYKDSFDVLFKTRIKLNVILLSSSSIDVSQAEINLGKEIPHYVASLVKYDKEKITGSRGKK